MLLQVRVHSAFLCQHRLRFDEFLDIVVFQYAVYYLVEFMRILGPVDDTSVFFSLGCKLVQIFIQVGDGVALNGTGLLAQLFPFLQSVCHIVTFGTYCPESGIMPFRIGLVLQEFLSCITMCCTHVFILLFDHLLFNCPLVKLSNCPISQSSCKYLHYMQKMHVESFFLGYTSHVHQA